MTASLDAKALSLSGRLQPTDLSLAAGDLACIVGPNGAGKTSLLHAIAGIGRPGGSVRVEGKDPTALAPDARKALLAYLPASRDLPWPVRAGDVIRLGLPPRESEDDLRNVLDALELAPLLDRRVDQLSTGERSRILIARALAPAPRLLLLDEPVANLDPYWQLRLMELLRERARESGCGLLLALHDLDLAARFADRLIVVAGGALAADGPPAAVLAGDVIREVFGIERSAGEWRPVRPSAGPRSSR
jgi:iron complex transport system ATP-binding protein